MCCFGFTSGDVRLWLKSYLQDRTQKMQCCGDEFSDSGQVSVGVPQGSIFGPLLFSMYVNDLLSVPLHCSISRYADDMAIFVSDHSLEVAE